MSGSGCRLHPKILSEREAFDADEEENKRDEEVDDGADGPTASADVDDIFYTKELRGGQRPINFNVSSDLKVKKKLLQKDTWIKNITKPEKTTTPSVEFGSTGVNPLDLIGIIDTFDRPGDAYTEETYARCGAYAVAFENEPGKRLPKAGAQCEAGVGRARAEFSMFEAEAKGPNASAGAEVSVGTLGVSAIARAELASASAKVGPVNVKVGLGVDTGVSAGAGGFEAKFLGTGFSIGPKTSISLLGSEVSCSVM